MLVPGRITDPPWLAQDSPPRAPSNEGSLFQLLGVLLVDALSCQPYRDPSAGENHLTPGPVLSPGGHRQWLSRDLAISAHSELIRRFTLTPKQILGGVYRAAVIPHHNLSCSSVLFLSLPPFLEGCCQGPFQLTTFCSVLSQILLPEEPSLRLR